MYDAHKVLASIDDHRWAIIALCTLAMICNYTWFFAAFRQARRDKVYSVPLFCTMFWLAGDGSMVWRYDTWFHTYDHWYPKLFWLALVFTVLFELAFVGQALRYGRDELVPSWTQGQFTVLILAGVAVGFVAWSFVKHVMGDPLYINYFHLGNLAGPVFAAALLLRRRSRAGQTSLIWGTYAVMETCWFLATALWFGPPFRSFVFILLYVVAVLAAVGMWYAVRRMPAYTRGDEIAAPVPADARVRRPSGGRVAIQ